LLQPEELGGTCRRNCYLIISSHDNWHRADLRPNRAAAKRSLGINVNLWWGLVMLLFGIIMLVLSRRAMSAPPRER